MIMIAGRSESKDSPEKEKNDVHIGKNKQKNKTGEQILFVTN